MDFCNLLTSEASPGNSWLWFVWCCERDSAELRTVALDSIFLSRFGRPMNTVEIVWIMLVFFVLCEAQTCHRSRCSYEKALLAWDA
jgi:hypothetical protein